MAYLAIRYAYLMTEEDVLDLFSILESRLGSTSEACRRCFIQRKTRYDWQRGKSIRPDTKRKVLKGFIENIPEETFDFLLDKAKDTAVEILSINLSNIRTQILRERIDRHSFAEGLRRIQEIKNRNPGLVWELGEEADEIMYQLEEKASSLNVPMPLENVDSIRPSQVMEILPSVIDEINRKGFSSYSQIARNLKVPEPMVQIISDSTRSLVVSRSPSITTENTMPVDISKLPSAARIEYPNIYEENPLVV